MNKQETHTIIGPAHIEGTQRGFVVWVKTDKRAKAQLTDANEDFAAASATAASIDKGRWVAQRKGGIFNVHGRKMTVSW
tara:strand:+ start:816 stop:1052 length:237 start_codon:yes stop_codon:yes gene_type:complete